MSSDVVVAVELLIAGAGPCGIACAVAARKAGLRAVVIDRGPIVSGIASYPTYMSFFSTAAKLSIGGVPFIVATEKPTRRDALAYYRGVASLFDLDVHQYETVTAVTSLAPDAGAATALPARWQVHGTRRSGVAVTYHAHAVVVATGYFGRPNRLGVPGEDLPHVQHGYTEGHGAWHEPVVIIGGGNSAVDAALDMYRAGALVTMVHFLPELDSKIKPWVRPEINARIADGSIAAHFSSRVVAIEPEQVVLAHADGSGDERRIDATQVYAMTGYLPETGLLEQADVPIDATTGIPTHDPATMATPLAGLYLAGVIASGFDANKIFIENGRDHGDRIVGHIISSSNRHVEHP